MFYRRRRTIRRRLRVAMWVGIASYGLLFGLRLAFHPPDQALVATLGWVIAGTGTTWLVLWLIAQRLAGRPNG
jgi:hypothetical protein